MIKKLIFLSVLLFIFAFTGVAGATFICQPPACPDGGEYNIWYDVDPVYEWLDDGETVSVNFHLDSFNSTYDSLFSAKTLFVFWGKPNSNYWGEYLYDVNNNGDHTQYEYISTNIFGWAFESEWLDDPVVDKLEATGSLSLDFTVHYLSDYGKCDWDWLKLKKAKLIAKGCDNPVPEPATLLLLGSGLVTFAGFGRKKFRNKGKK